MLRRRKRSDEEEDRGPARVLVVNDEPDACELLCRVLSGAGYVVDRAHDEEVALATLDSFAPDCVILDLSASGIGSNLKLLETIRSLDDLGSANVRVLMTSKQTQYKLFSWQSGVDAFLVRPFHVDDLLRDLAEALERSEDERALHRRQQLAGAKREGRTIEAQPRESFEF